MFWSRINGFLATALWLSAVAALVYAADAWRRGVIADTPLIGRMLVSGELLVAAAPIAILGVLTLVLVQLLSRALTVFAEQSAAAEFGRWINTGASSAPSGALSNPSQNRAARRAHLVRKSGPRGVIGEAMSGASALDAGNLASRYGWLHAFAWLLPVLGFVGTATGMAASIAGFREALIDTTRMEVVVARLAQEVIPGLAAAFETTVLALIAALITFVCANALQSADEAALQRLDDASLDHVAAIAVAGGAASGDTPKILREISAKLDRLSLLQEVSRKLDTLAAIAEGVRGLGQMPKELAESASALKQGAQQVSEAAGTLKGASQELAASVTIPYKVRIERGS